MTGKLGAGLLVELRACLAGSLAAALPVTSEVDLADRLESAGLPVPLEAGLAGTFATGLLVTLEASLSGTFAAGLPVKFAAGLADTLADDDAVFASLLLFSSWKRKLALVTGCVVGL